MRPANDHIDNLIVQLLCGELDKPSLQELRAWIDRSHENASYFRERQEIWFSSVETSQLGKYNKKEMYESFLRNTAEADADENRQDSFLYRQRKWIGYAATLLAVVTMTFFAYHRGEQRLKKAFADIQVEAPNGSRTKALLSDGTVVWLNSGSRLTYSQGYGLNDRKVAIDGEGYFEVKHNKDLPFSVNSKTLQVNVLGTKFSFRDYSDDQEAEVMLEEGSVKLDNLMNANLPQLMTPGQKVVLDKKTGEMTTTTCDVSSIRQWAQGMIVFNDATLDEIAKRIERSYNVTVQIQDGTIRKYRFNGDFVRQEQSLKEVLDALAETGRLHYRLHGRTVTIY